MAYSYQTADPMLYPLLRDFARKNRNNPTEAETLLWNYLENKGFRVIRFTNEELFDNIDQVLEKIKDNLYE